MIWMKYYVKGTDDLNLPLLLDVIILFQYHTHLSFLAEDTNHHTDPDKDGKWTDGSKGSGSHKTATGCLHKGCLTGSTVWRGINQIPGPKSGEILEECVWHLWWGLLSLTALQSCSYS